MRTCFKGYIGYKTIFCHKVTLYLYLTNFFDLNKKQCFLFEIFRFFCFCDIYRFQNLWHYHKHCYIMEAILINGYLFWMLCTTRVKFGQILVCCMRNISNLFLAQCWRLETNSRLFYFFIKMTIKQDLTIFNSWHLPFFIVPYLPFQEDATLESWHNLLWVIEAGF